MKQYKIKKMKLTLNKVTKSLPEFTDNKIIFFEHQPMSDIGYYNNDEKTWYILELSNIDNKYYYNTDKDCGLKVEYWVNFPTNF